MSKKVTYILDCDGVILDSNLMKVKAMRDSLESFQLFSSNDISNAIKNFKSNFGMSRYWHIEQFIKILKNTPPSFAKDCIGNYEKIVRKKYLSVPLCEGIECFLKNNKSKKYVVSGSNQLELNKVFKDRRLDNYFELILGSPTSKKENISSIITSLPKSQFIMIGDSHADMNASITNAIDFIFYKPYSLVISDLEVAAQSHNFKVLSSWADIT